MGNKRIFLSCPTMGGKEMDFIKEAFDTNWIAPLGANVDGFENELTQYIGEGMYGAALSAGTAALHLGVKLLGIKPGDIVLCSSLTFSATVNPVVYEGGIPVFVDSEPDTWNMDPKALERAFEKYPDAKAVVLVHLYGVPAKLDEILAICEAHNVPLLEDAAESLGALYKGRQTGTFGKVGIYSFNGNKIITTSGGGMLVSKEEELVKKARFLSTQAREPFPHYEHKEIGYNYRMSNIVAGIGRGQLLCLDAHIAKKKKIYETYKEAFKDIPVITMNPYMEETTPNFWLSCITLAPDSKVKPKDIMDALGAENIESRPIWKPMHLQPVFADNDYITAVEGESFCQTIFENGVCLPSDVKNTEEDMEKIIKLVKDLF